jgi:uncharacterized protein YkwD
LLRRAVIPFAVAAIVFGSAACQPRPASGPTASRAGASDASQMLTLINGYRAANGLPGLSTEGDAMAKAQQHADEMAAQGHIFHSSSLSSGIADGWTALGENVGMGGSPLQLQGMFQGSGPHNANMLNGAYNFVGVGAARGSDGQLYVTEDFVGR